MKSELKIFLSGIALIVGLTIVFLILKLIGVVSWSWWTVFSPLLIYAALLIATAIAAVYLYIHYKNHP